MSHFMSPCLLACALGLVTAGSLAAATAASTSERDQQALAVKQLVMKGMRLPALRQIDEYKAAGYPDEGGWVAKVLREAYLLRFLSELPPPAPTGPQPAAVDPKAASGIDPKLQKEVEALTKELDAAAKSNTLPAIAKTIRGGGGNSIERLVNELGRFINPSLPKPLVEAGPEKRQAATNLADVLRKAMDEDFKKSFAKVKEHQVLEKPMWDLDDKSPEYKRLVSESVDMRIEALQSLYLAIIGLREVSLRGAEFGIPEAATATTTFLKTFFTDHHDTLNQWDFEWGEFNPFIHDYANVLLGEAVRLGVKDCKEEDVEAGLQAVMDFDVRTLGNKSGELIEAYKLKVGAWSNMLRFKLEQGTSRAYVKALKLWDDFLERAKSDPLLRLGGSPKLNVELGQLYILAARLFHAKDENAAANSLLGELIAQKPANPLAGNAKAWLSSFNSSDTKSGGGWSAAPLATDPSTTINLARAFMSEANASVDPLRQRAQWLNAAIALRNAVLGLNGAPDKVLIEFGPTIYDMYAQTLYKLGMRQHAAVVSVEGSRLFANYLDALTAAKKPNPWFVVGTKNWDESFTTPVKLVRDANYYSNNLSFLDKNMQRITEDALSYLRRIIPSDFGPGQLWQEIVASSESGEYAAALAKTEEFAKQYPDQALKAFGAAVSIRQRWVDQLIKEGGHSDEVKRIQDEGAVANKKVLELIDTEQNRSPPPTPERQKLLDGARSAVLGAQIDGMVMTKKYVEAMDLVTPMLLKQPPSDEALAARMLKLLCRAANEYNAEATAGDKIKDITALQANWRRYSDIYRCAQKMLPKLRNHGVDTDIKNASIYLAGVFAAVANQVNMLQQSASVPAAVLAYVEESNRAFADLFEPCVDDKTRPANILFCANKLWEVEAKERAARLYLKYQVTLASDTELDAFQKDPKPILDKYGEAVLVRTEFKKYWEEIADLAWDSPEWLEAYNKGLPADQMPPSVHADYFKANRKIAEFRSKILIQQKLVMAPEQYKAIETSLDGLQRLLTALANSQMVMRHLAAYYRESGQFDLALPLLKKLFDFDTRDPDAMIAIIDATRRKMLEGPAKREDLISARQLAANVREEMPPTNKLGHWEAEILVMEFSIGLGEIKVVNDTLGFMQRNRSDLSHDLVAPSVEGDDKRVRRALNNQAIDLAKRFLDLYTKTGITVKATFRVDEIDAGVKTLAIYTDLDAPKFVARTIKNKDDDDVLVIVSADAPATPEPGASAPPATSTAPAPAAVIPAPAPVTPAPAAARGAAPKPAAGK